MAGRLQAELGLAAVVPSYGERVVLSPSFAYAGAAAGKAAPDSIAVEVQVPAGLPSLTRAGLGGIPVSGAQVSGELTARPDGPDVVLEGTITIRIRRAPA